MWLSWRHGLPLGTEIWGGEDAEFEPRCLRRTWRLSRFWPTTWKQSPSVSPTGAGFGSLHRRLRQQTVLRRLNTKHPPGKGPFAVRAAPVLSPWLPSVAPGSRGGGGPRVGFRGARCRSLLPVPARPGGLGKFLRRASPSFLGRARVGCLPWRGCGAAEHHHLLFRQHTGAGAASKQHRQQTPAASPKEKSYPVNRRAPVAAVVGPEVAGGSRGRRDGRPCLP